jgi:hypothetical protein
LSARVNDALNSISTKPQQDTFVVGVDPLEMKNITDYAHVESVGDVAEVSAETVNMKGGV